MSKSAWMTYDGPKPVMPLSDQEYSSVAFAWRALLAVSTIEDSWEIVVQNYMEFEQTILRSALEGMVGADRDHSQAQDERLRFTRAFANLLSSCRAYLDQSGRELKRADCTEYAETLRVFAKREYDEKRSYALMEELRNYAQHRGLPIHGLTTGGSWSLIENNGRKEKGTYRFFAQATVTLTNFKDDSRFRKVLSRFPNDNKLNVTRLTREYVEALSQIHADLREEMASSTSAWKDEIRALLKRYALAADCTPAFILVGEYSDASPGLGTQMFEEVISRVEEMSRRNGALTNLSRRYVSTELAD